MRKLILIWLATLGLIGCERERRDFVQPPAMSTAAQGVSVSELHPAGLTAPPPVANIYSESAYAVNEGKRLYSWYNCGGCHFHGGGESGRR